MRQHPEHFVIALLTSGLLLIGTALFPLQASETSTMPTATKITGDGLLRKQAHGDMETVWTRLIEAVKATKAPIFSVVDHRPMHRAWGWIWSEPGS